MSSARSLPWCVLAVTLGLAGCPRDRASTTADAGGAGAAAASSSVAHPEPKAAAATSARVDVVSSASKTDAGWDSGALTLGADAIDGKALRDRHRARISADTSAVTVLQGGTPRELGVRLCEATVPSRPKETPILIKPNIGGFEWFKDPAKNDGDDGVRGRTTERSIEPRRRVTSGGRAGRRSRRRLTGSPAR